MKFITRLCSVLLFAMSAAASAAPMIFQITGTGGATLGGAPLAGPFELRLSGDTSAIVVSPSSADANEITTLTSAVLTFQGQTPLTFNTSKRAGFNTSTGSFFFGNPVLQGGLDLFDFITPAAPAYVFGNPYATTPVTSIFLAQFTNIGTSGGLLTFDTATNVQFTAFFDRGGPSVVPLPGAAALLMGGLLLLAPLTRRARRG